MDRKTVVIRKYENRRLYDTSASRYVNLDDVAEMVRGGMDVQVVDATTGEDLTRVVLTQIIVENAKAPGSAFPLDMLRQMVVATGRVSQESMLKYMRAMFDMYQSAYRTLAHQLGPFDFLGGMGAGAGSAAPARHPAPPSGPASGGASGGADDEMVKLRRRIEELESLIARPAGTRARRKPKKTAPRR
jgi:polyhydroxyalkanoate synthesis repressor PhaR